MSTNNRGIQQQNAKVRILKFLHDILEHQSQQELQGALDAQAQYTAERERIETEIQAAAEVLSEETAQSLADLQASQLQIAAALDQNQQQIALLQTQLDLLTTEQALIGSPLAEAATSVPEELPAGLAEPDEALAEPEQALAAEQSLAAQLDGDRGLYSDGNLYENWGGQNEKWLQDATNAWYFILSNGDLYRWDGSSFAAGTLAASLDPSYYQNIGKLVDAATLATIIQNEVSVSQPEVAAVAAQLDRDLGLYSTGDEYLNYFGAEEKWLMGSSGWYFILPNGQLYQWDGTDAATGTLVGTLEAWYYQDLSKLLDG